MWARLGSLARHLGKKVVHAAEHSIGKLSHMGKKLHEVVGKVPMIGGALQSGLEAAYDMPIPVVGSVRNAFEGAQRAVQVGKHLVSDDPDVRQEGYRKILNGEVGSAAQRGAQAVQRIASALS